MHSKSQIAETDIPKFSNLGIDQRLLQILDKLKFHTPTPIQHKAIPVALEKKDIIGIAQTGTGKTLAFGLPILHQLFKKPVRTLILLPTRELALQVEETFQKVGGSFGLRTVVLIGGTAINRQVQGIKRNPHIIIGTPGRIIDHIQQKTLHLNNISILVLDEADRMLDMGFKPQINQILKTLPKERQTMLFSATMPDDIVRIAVDHMKLPVRVEIAKSGTTAEGIEQEIFIVEKSHKDSLLELLLKKHSLKALVFSRTKYGAKKICRKLNQAGHRAAEIHSNKSLNQRQAALNGFKTGAYQVLVATDIAARGIDVKDIGLVINYDIPEFAEDYVHRIGRTARAGEKGRAITFACPDQHSKIKQIERLIKSALKVSTIPGFTSAKLSSESTAKHFYGHSRSRRNQRMKWRVR
jgi:ATP-dependent RNA helicase RhlE